MKFILIDADLFDSLTEKIRTLTEEVEKVCKEMDYASQKWLDSQDVCHIMGISYRTLQYYREKGEISYESTSFISYCESRRSANSFNVYSCLSSIHFMKFNTGLE